VSEMARLRACTIYERVRACTIYERVQVCTSVHAVYVTAIRLTCQIAFFELVLVADANQQEQIIFSASFKGFRTFVEKC